MRAYGSLRRSADFTRVYRRGKAARGKHLVLFAVREPRDQRSALVGFAVPKTVGKAVARNLVRRRAQAALDACGLQSWTGWRLVVLAKPGSAQASYRELSDELQRALERVAP